MGKRSLTCYAIFCSRVKSPHWRHTQPPILRRVISSAHILPLDSRKQKKILRFRREDIPRLHTRARLLKLLREHKLLEPLVHSAAFEQTWKWQVGRHFLQQVIRQEFPERGVEIRRGLGAQLPLLGLGLHGLAVRRQHPRAWRGRRLLHRRRHSVEPRGAKPAATGLEVPHLVTHRGELAGRWNPQSGARAISRNSVACQTKTHKPPLKPKAISRQATESGARCSQAKSLPPLPSNRTPPPASSQTPTHLPVSPLSYPFSYTHTHVVANLPHSPTKSVHQKKTRCPQNYVPSTAITSSFHLKASTRLASHAPLHYIPAD